MLKSRALLLFSCIFFLKTDEAWSKAAVNYKTIDGLLVNVVDDCDLKDPDSCGTGKCCAKQTMMYLPEYYGQKPVYTISCQPMKSAGEKCFTDLLSNEMCPCATGLTCSPGIYYPMGVCVKY